MAAGGIGIDWGVAQPLALSDGTVIELPRVSVAEQAQLAVLQQRVSRKRLGSANRRKAVAQLNRFLRKVRCRRLDALQKVTTGLAKNHRLLVIEELQVQDLTDKYKRYGARSLWCRRTTPVRNARTVARSTGATGRPRPGLRAWPAATPSMPTSTPPRSS